MSEPDLFSTASVPVTVTIIGKERFLWPAQFRDLFWQAYPRRIAKLAAMRALEKVNKRQDVQWDHFIAAVEKYARWCQTKEKQFIKHPATWLNGGCWDDEYDLRENSATNRPIGSRVSGLELEYEQANERR